MQAWLEMLSFMPGQLQDVLKKISTSDIRNIEEIRIRAGRPLAIMHSTKIYYVSKEGKFVQPHLAYHPDMAAITEILRLLSHSSLYTWEEELRQGYVTIKGGHRVGLAGRALTEKGRIRSMKDISSLNFRLAREIPGCAQKVASEIFCARPQGTILIAPPRGGKTTLLRDLVRITSEKGYNVVVVDERSEIAACWQGIPQKNLGPNTDVLDACPKAEGMMLAIRSMGPDVVAVDEIGKKEDAESVWEAAKAGITVYATAHAANIKEAMARPLLKEILAMGIFKKAVILQPDKRGEYEITDIMREMKVC